MAIDSSVTLMLNNKWKISGATYARAAELIMDNFMAADGDKLSVSKLRGIYSLITNVYTRVSCPDDFDACKADLQYIKVKMAYESGRKTEVKSFITQTGLMTAIDGIATYDQFLLYCRYAESLVAYFKFFGGKE